MMLTCFSRGFRELPLLVFALSSISVSFVVAVQTGRTDATKSKYDYANCVAAISEGRYDFVVKALELHPELAKESDPEARETLLHHIAVYGDYRRVGTDAEAKAIAKLVSCGADLDAYNRHGMTPLMQVALYYKWRMATQLLDAGANPFLQRRVPGDPSHDEEEMDCNESVVDIAASRGFAKLVAGLLEMGAPIEYPETIPKPDEPPRRPSALHLCCLGQYDRQSCERTQQMLATIDLLCARISDINLIDRNRKTPLLVAAECSSTVIVEHLLARYPKVNVHAVDDDGNSALHLAVVDGPAEDGARIVRVLLKHGADPQLRNIAEETPLDIARRRKEQLLIDALSGK